MDRTTKRTGLASWIALLIALVVSVLLARAVNSAAGWVASVLLGFGLLVALVSYFQMHLEERERNEKLEFDEINRTRNSATLFEAPDSDTFPARRSREQFERYLVPVFTIVLLLLQAAALYGHWAFLEKERPAPSADHAAVCVSVYGLLWLLLFLFGKYAAGLARLDNLRLLQPTASYLLLGAYAALAAAFSIGLSTWGNLPQADRWFARGLSVVIALVGLETLLVLIFEIYRPRVKGKRGRLLYDSRLVALLGQPEGIFSTAAHALDYQFGFKVSETWFYRFLEEKFGWIVLIQVGILLLSTCVVFVEPGDQALLERFGREAGERAVLEPGPHLKMPWPIEKVRRFTTSGLQSFNIGFVHDEKRQGENTILWNVSHYKEEFNLLVASRETAVSTNAADAAVPVNLLTVSIPVQYQINNLRFWAYHFTDAGDLLEKTATREVVRYLVGVDINEMMSIGRTEASRILRERIQARADELELGVSVVFVGLQDIHPPVKVADAYQAVIGAQQQIQTNILAAEGYKFRTVPLAEAEAHRRVRAAEAYRLTRVAGAVARAAQFTNQITAFNASPRVYPERLYLQSFASAISGTRKYVIAPTNVHDVIQINLEDKIRADLLRVAAPTNR